MNWLKELDLTNWNMWSALAAWIELMFFFIPAIGYFLYSKISYVDYWIFNQTESGMKIAIHNKSKTSLFVLQEEICVKNRKKSCTYQLPVQSNHEVNYMCIQPDGVIYINIDYAIYQIVSSDQIILFIQFGGKRYKQKKIIKRESTYVCES